MANFNDFLDTLKENLGDLFKENWQDFFDAVQEMGHDFIESIKEDLKEWTKALAEGKQTKEEFEFLLKTKRDLMKLKLLTDAGMTKIRIEKLQQAIFDVTVKTAASVFLK